MTLDPVTNTAALPALLRERYGLDVHDLTLVHGELDLTYRVESSAGRLAVKVRDAVNPSLDFELRVLVALADAGLPAPAMRPTIDGSDRCEGNGVVVWVTNWIDGVPWAEIAHRPAPLLRDLGRTAFQAARALGSLEHAAAMRTHHWDLRAAGESLRRHANEASSPLHAHIVEDALNSFDSRVAPRLDALPSGVVHQDLNDHNILVESRPGAPTIVGLLDPGDALYSVVVSELAVAVAYAMLREAQPLDAAVEVVSGWCEDGSLSQDEVECIFPMAVARLCVNATTWAHRGALGQAEYADARSQHTWTTLERLVQTHPDVAATAFRHAASLAVQPGPAVPAASTAAFVPADGGHGDLVIDDLDPHRDRYDEVDPTDLGAVSAAGVTPFPQYLRHLSVRLDRGGPPDGDGGPATIQVGAVMRASEAFACKLPLGGIVADGDNGRLVVTHTVPDGPVWSIWYGVETTATHGMALIAGETLGDTTDVQVQLSRIEPSVTSPPRFVRPRDRDMWADLSPDPASFLGIADDETDRWLSGEEVVALRGQRLASSQQSYYERPPNLVRARGSWFVDDHAHHFLDAINNVTHVGHGHTHVVEAAARQMRRLNTNSRFVYEEMARYADRLAATLPDPLNVVFLVCTGSEANDLALRIARQVTGRDDIAVIDGAYHGNTTAVTGISPNRYNGSGGAGAPPTTHEVMQPNMYRGPFAGEADPGLRYAADIESVVDRLAAEGRPPAAFIAESLMGTAGQIVHPSGYLSRAFAHVRSAGGLCISDEVQVGFGRLGHHFWGFELGGVVPDIVTMGKPMGNGHPIAAVVTTREIADSFDTGMKYFNTFGGNPVSCAIAGAVLDVVEDEQLQQQALDVGSHFRARLDELAVRCSYLGDVRGEGLYLGVEFVTDRTTKTPAAALTTALCERLLKRGVIVYPNGDLGNVLKIKPPMVFSHADADRFVDQLDATLEDLGVR